MELLYDLYENHLTPQQTIDIVVDGANVSHKDFRQWCRDNKKPLPSPTPGLALEIAIEAPDLPSGQLCKLYNLTMHELRHCQNNDCFNDISSLSLKLTELREQGISELEIGRKFGLVARDTELLANELTTLIDNGDKQSYLAELYELSPSRVSQLYRGPKRKRTDLTVDQKANIRSRRQESAPSLAKEFGVTRNTIYVIWRS